MPPLERVVMTDSIARHIPKKYNHNKNNLTILLDNVANAQPSTPSMQDNCNQLHRYAKPFHL